LKQLTSNFWAHRSFESAEFLSFGLFIGLYFFIGLGASVFESLNAIYEQSQVEQSKVAQTYTGGLVERSWKLPFRPPEVSESLGIAELP
jgi:hypothetical protein